MGSNARLLRTRHGLRFVVFVVVQMLPPRVKDGTRMSHDEAKGGDDDHAKERNTSAMVERKDGRE
jgi:hypothetical protein